MTLMAWVVEVDLGMVRGGDSRADRQGTKYIAPAFVKEKYDDKLHKSSKR